MVGDARTLVFFDASCPVVAAGRTAGGAGYVPPLGSRDLLLTTHRAVVPIPNPAGPSGYASIAGEKDVHVVAAAVAAGAPFLLTLDKPLSRAVNDADLPTHAFSPGEFNDEVLPRHADVDRLRR